jgi:hypothetical protein
LAFVLWSSHAILFHQYCLKAWGFCSVNSLAALFWYQNVYRGLSQLPLRQLSVRRGRNLTKPTEIAAVLTWESFKILEKDLGGGSGSAAQYGAAQYGVAAAQTQAVQARGGAAKRRAQRSSSVA